MPRKAKLTNIRRKKLLFSPPKNRDFTLGMVVQHNMNALNAYNRLNANVAGLRKASEKLSSGYRINRAGDDAAGLAISEKMRSQIKGLNQAVRNSQDGINMIQTFEGAAQETHSILQRMKELAMESANGTYDNITDRAALQLEFDQLNDELNQIADTDFNGTIVLNGGEMSDGLKVTDFDNGLGTFDYANKADQAAAAKKAIEDEIAKLTASKPEDIGANTAKWDSVQDATYDKAAAANLWKDLGLDDTVADVDITFSWDGKNWVASSAKAYDGDGLDTTDNDVAMADDKKGNLIDGKKVDLSKLKIAASANGTGTGKGGFTVTTATGTSLVANAIFDATDVKVGDTVTLNFTNPASKTYAPNNIGMADDSFKYSNEKSVGTAKPQFSVKVADGDMTQQISDILTALKGQKITAKATADTATPDAVAKINIGGTDLAANKKTINGEDMWIEFDTGKLTISALDGAGTGKGTELLEIDFTNVFDPTTGNTKGGDTVEFTLTMDAFNFDDSATYDVSMTAGKPDTSAIDKKIAELEAELNKKGVSVSDAFDKSEAIMNYAEHIVLQTGARTKDAVDFTFNYNKADMGDLEANLNLSARADGLNTENLSLANQIEANHAIDQIDKAINKTSMVRASFGAIQNRLEHKITNLTTTSENLTESESNIRDTDMASEMMNYTKFNILQQAAQSMLAQANQQPQSILQLLG